MLTAKILQMEQMGRSAPASRRIGEEMAPYSALDYHSQDLVLSSESPGSGF